MAATGSIPPRPGADQGRRRYGSAVRFPPLPDPPAAAVPDTQPSVPHPAPDEAIRVEDAIAPPDIPEKDDEAGTPPERVQTKREAQEDRTAGDL